MTSFGYTDSREKLPAPRQQLRRCAFALALCGTILLAAGGTIAAPPAELTFNHFDKLIHVAVYGLVATAFCRIGFDPRRPWRAVLYGTTMAVLFGMADEARQYLNPARYFEWADVAADFSGALIATLAYAHWPFYRRLLEWRLFVRTAAGRNDQNRHPAHLSCADAPPNCPLPNAARKSGSNPQRLLS